MQLAHKITLRDSERIVLEKSMEHYEAYCNEMILSGKSTPFKAHLSSIKAIREKLTK